MKSFAITIAAFLFLGCASVTQSDNEVAAAESSSQQADPCAATDPERRMVIEVGENQMASICRADGIGDCLYTHAFGELLDTHVLENVLRFLSLIADIYSG